MKKKSSQSAFFNLRVLIGLFMVLAGVFLALLGFGTFSGITASSAKAQQNHKFIMDPKLGIFSPGFDCSQIHARGIDKQENMRAGAIMIACGEAQGGSAPGGVTSSNSAVSELIKSLLPSPSFIGGSDVDVILPDGTFPHVTQSESMEWCGANNTCVVNYNDSRTAPSCYSGISYSTDGGTTWHASQQLCSGHGTNFGDPIVVYNAHLNKWFAGDLATGCGGQGVGVWTSPDGITWTPGACAANTGQGDRESMWVDNNSSSPFYGRMYVSFNDFNVGGGALYITHSDDGITWTPVQLNPSFIRDVQTTGDLQGSGRVYVASMNENGGGLSTRQNVMYRSTDGGVTWANSPTGPAFNAVGRVACTANSYFVCMFGTDAWRHMGWGEPAANGSVVSLDYAQKGAGSDLGDIYYVRSTDAGVTWGTPVKLNTDSGTAMQWQPSMAATQAGAIFASWYDQREVNGGADLNCTAGSPSQNCYRRWGRVSFDNGATWQPDDMVGRALTPLPGQPDGGVQPNYQGDYDYHSSNGTNIIGGWTDGRNIISNQSQQDVFVNFVQGGFGVTSTIPACNSVINTQPTNFVVNLSGAVDPTTVQATDFTVNGIPANSFTLGMSNTQITFTFNSSPVTMQGPQTMHIPAGAFNDTSNHPVADFTCTFCYALTPLQVTTTNPPVGGTFSPPAPGTYTYDVNFNQAIDPGSVSTSDLTLTGNVGGSVTNVTVINGNTTAEFTVTFQFGGSVTASIAAGAITAEGCNPNAAFSGNYTVLGCPPNQYLITPGNDPIVPGTTDTGSHCDDCATTVALPFPFQLYGTTYNSVGVVSNGFINFVSPNSTFVSSCIPTTGFDNTIFPLWEDLRTDAGLSGCSTFSNGCGIFTSVSGTMPNRIFNIEWHAVLFGNNASTENFEVRLYENSAGTNGRFDVIYGNINITGATQMWVGGVQGNSGGGFFTQDFCLASTGQPPHNVSHAYTFPVCAPMASDAFSRKVHGGAGTFDIPLPLTGNVGVECRSGGGVYQMIIDFPSTVTVGSASVTSGTGMVSSFSGSGTSQITVNLSGVTDVQRITMTLHNVNDGTHTGDVPIPMGVLIGDVNGNASVNASDVALTKSKVGQAVDGTNFREDVNVNGTISSTDVALVKSKVGNALPP